MMETSLIKIFLDNKKLILLGGIGVALVAFGFFYYLTPSQWEAQAVIRVAHVPQIKREKEKIELEPIEPIVNVIESMRQQSFLQDVLENAGLTKGMIAEAPRMRELASENIEVKVRGFTKEDTRQYLDAVLVALKKRHDKVFEEHLNLIQGELLRVETRLSIDQTLMQNERPLLNKSIKKTSDMNELLMLSILMRKMEEVAQLSEYRIRLKDSLSPLKTYPTEFLGGVKISDNFIYPSKLLFIIFALFSGIFAASVIFLRMCVLKKRCIDEQKK